MSLKTNQFPSLFISHGSPMMAVEKTSTHSFLKSLGTTLPPPKAVLVVSAHWETAEPMLTAHPQPHLVYDFYGFPDELYRLKYAPPAAVQTSTETQAMVPLSSLDPDRGLDHGAWVPLMLMYPAAAVPVLQLSVQPHKDAAHHYAVGQKLAALREQGVLILGSGNATHNLRAAFTGRYSAPPEMVTSFADWLHQTLISGDHETAKNWVRAAPHALWNHPTPEHFLPLFTALGAAGASSEAKRIHADVDMNVLAMDAYSFNN